MLTWSRVRGWPATISCKPGKVRVGGPHDDIDGAADVLESGHRARGHVRGVGAADEHEDPLDGAVAGPPTCPRQGELGAQQRVRRPGEDARAGWHQSGVGIGTRAQILVQHEVDWKRPIGEVIDGHQRRSGHAAAHPREPLRAEAIVVADDERGLSADRRADLGRLVLTTPPQGEGSLSDAARPAASPSGRSRVARWPASRAQ